MQTANLSAAFFCCLIASIQISLALDVTLPDAVSFIPMKLSETNPTASQTNLRHAFQLSPATFAVYSPQPRNITNLAADGNGFDVSNLADDFKVHQQCI